MARHVNEILQAMEISGLADKAAGRLRMRDLSELYECSADPMELICNAYNLGFLKGMKAQHSNNRKRK